MILSSNNLSVLPFYTSVKEQNRNKDYAFGNVYPLNMPMNMVLPFQIITPPTGGYIDWVEVYDINGKFIMNIQKEMFNGGLSLKQYPQFGYDIIFYPGIMPLNINLQGQYYLVLYKNQVPYVSDVFTWIYKPDRCLKIQWWDEEDLIFDAGRIVYTNQFRNVVYLDTELGKPEYTFEDEGENRDGYYFPEKQLSEKVYKFTFLAPEYLLDAMRLIRLSDHIVVTNKGKNYVCDTFLITPKWTDQGDIASVEAEFETATVVKKIGPRRVINNNGDYNIDFNNDYNNKQS